MKNTVAVEIVAPVERVFRWIDEPDCVLQWLTHLSEYERSDETEVKVGTRLRQVWLDNGRRTEFEGQITAYSPYSELGIKLSTKKLNIQVDYTLRDVGGKTHLTQTTLMQYSGLLRLIDSIAGRSLQKSYLNELKRNFARLVDLCESESATE